MGVDELGGAIDQRALVAGAESGTVTAGNKGIVTVNRLAAGETLRVAKAIHMLADGTAPPSGADAKIITLNNSGGTTDRVTVHTGDGSTLYDGGANSTGTPLTTWENTTGGPVTAGYAVDNGSGNDIDVMALIRGKVV